jgi:hypothetical protein
MFAETAYFLIIWGFVIAFLAFFGLNLATSFDLCGANDFSVGIYCKIIKGYAAFTCRT